MFFQRIKRNIPLAEWKRKQEKVKQRLRNLPEYVERAVDTISFEKHGAGRPKKLDLVQRTMLFLFARLMNKSNRDAEDLLEMFEPLFGVTVSYKYIERLYSDEEVKTVLHNLCILLLREEGVSDDFSGGGTGYSMTITKHYRTNPMKKGKDYIYVFRVIDVDTGLYVAFGYSNKSEMEAFHKAMVLLHEWGIPLDSLSLDKYLGFHFTSELFFFFKYSLFCLSQYSSISCSIFSLSIKGSFGSYAKQRNFSPLRILSI